MFDVPAGRLEPKVLELYNIVRLRLIHRVAEIEQQIQADTLRGLQNMTNTANTANTANTNNQTNNSTNLQRENAELRALARTITNFGGTLDQARTLAQKVLRSL